MNASPPEAPPPAASASGRWTSRLALLGALLGALLLAGGGLYGLRLMEGLERQNQWVSHTQQVQLQVERVRADLRGAGRAVLDDLLAVQALSAAGAAPEATPEAATRQARLSAALLSLSQLVMDNPLQSAELTGVVAAIEVHLRQLQDLARSSPTERAGQLTQRRDHATALEQRLDQFSATEAGLLSERQQVVASSLQRERWRIGVVTISGLVLLMAAVLMAVHEARLRRLAEAHAWQAARDLQLANQTLEARVRQRTAKLQLASHAQLLRNDATQGLMAALDDADELPALLAWRQRLLDSGLVTQLQLQLVDHEPIGTLDSTGLAPELRVCVDLPLALGRVLLTRRQVPADEQAAAMHRDQMANDLASWLELRRRHRRREQAERQRDRMQAQLLALFEQSPVGLALLDPSLSFLRVNQAMADFDGAIAAQLIGRTVDEVLGDEPGQRRRVVMPALRQVQGGGPAVVQRSLHMPMASHGNRAGHLLLSVLPLRDPGTAPGGAIFGIALIGQDITEQDQARERLAQLTRQLMEATENERRSLARELHDDLGQQMAALKMNLQLLQPSVAALPAQADMLAESVQIVEAVIGQLRQRAASLRPPQLDELGLAAALRDHAQQQALRAGVTVQVQVKLPEQGLRDEWCSHVFRIVQEALRNAIEHGRPQQVQISLQATDGGYGLSVCDDGQGGDQAGPARTLPQRGMGLLNMRERTELLGGSFWFELGAAGGAQLRCHWPLSAVLVDAADDATTQAQDMPAMQAADQPPQDGVA